MRRLGAFFFKFLNKIIIGGFRNINIYIYIYFFFFFFFLGGGGVENWGVTTKLD